MGLVTLEGEKSMTVYIQIFSGFLAYEDTGHLNTKECAFTTA